jgi:hypothetical protein
MLNECWIATLLWSKIVLCAHFECNVALHVDMTTSTNGTYKIFLESTEDIPEDQVNITKGVSEAPNQSSEDIDISDFSPTSKGKPRCITQYFRLLHYAILYLYIISYIKSWKWNGTLDALNPRNLCIVPESLSHRCSANRTGRSRAISCHSRYIGVECLPFRNHYKDHGWGHVQWHDLDVYPVCVVKSW